MVDLRAGPDPRTNLERFLDRQRRTEQFSEDMRTVMYGGYGSGAEGAKSTGALSQGYRTPNGLIRTRSPGLAAGGALTLGPPVNASEAYVEARSACLAAAENARRRTCPFDDHQAFGASPEDLERPQRLPPVIPDQARVAHQMARRLGKMNRELQQRVGAGAPWDAPERAPTVSSNAVVQARLQAEMQPTAFSELRAEALRNKSRMQGSEDLLAGNYLLGDSAAAKRNRSLPPRTDVLLPQAHMKVQFDGGSLASLTRERAAYLNAKVLAESNRDRNETNSMRVC